MLNPKPYTQNPKPHVAPDSSRQTAAQRLGKALHARAANALDATKRALLLLGVSMVLGVSGSGLRVWEFWG